MSEPPPTNTSVDNAHGPHPMPSPPPVTARVGPPGAAAPSEVPTAPPEPPVAPPALSRQLIIDPDEPGSLLVPHSAAPQTVVRSSVGRPNPLFIAETGSPPDQPTHRGPLRWLLMVLLVMVGAVLCWPKERRHVFPVRVELTDAPTVTLSEDAIIREVLVGPDTILRPGQPVLVWEPTATMVVLDRSSAAAAGVSAELAGVVDRPYADRLALTEALTKRLPQSATPEGRRLVLVLVASARPATVASIPLTALPRRLPTETLDRQLDRVGQFVSSVDAELGWLWLQQTGTGDFAAGGPAVSSGPNSESGWLPSPPTRGMLDPIRLSLLPLARSAAVELREGLQAERDRRVVSVPTQFSSSLDWRVAEIAGISAARTGDDLHDRAPPWTGQAVRAGQPILVLAEPSRVRLVATIPAELMGRVSVGDVLRLSVPVPKSTDLIASEQPPAEAEVLSVTPASVPGQPGQVTARLLRRLRFRLDASVERGLELSNVAEPIRQKLAGLCEENGTNYEGLAPLRSAMESRLTRMEFDAVWPVIQPLAFEAARRDMPGDVRLPLPPSEGFAELRLPPRSRLAQWLNLP